MSLTIALFKAAVPSEISAVVDQILAQQPQRTGKGAHEIQPDVLEKAASRFVAGSTERAILDRFLTKISPPHRPKSSDRTKAKGKSKLAEHQAATGGQKRPDKSIGAGSAPPSDSGLKSKVSTPRPPATPPPASVAPGSVQPDSKAEDPTPSPAGAAHAKNIAARVHEPVQKRAASSLASVLQPLRDKWESELQTAQASLDAANNRYWSDTRPASRSTMESLGRHVLVARSNPRLKAEISQLSNQVGILKDIVALLNRHPSLLELSDWVYQTDTRAADLTRQADLLRTRLTMGMPSSERHERDTNRALSLEIQAKQISALSAALVWAAGQVGQPPPLIDTDAQSTSLNPGQQQALQDLVSALASQRQLLEQEEERRSRWAQSAASESVAKIGLLRAVGDTLAGATSDEQIATVIYSSAGANLSNPTFSNPDIAARTSALKEAMESGRSPQDVTATKHRALATRLLELRVKHAATALVNPVEPRRHHRRHEALASPVGESEAARVILEAWQASPTRETLVQLRESMLSWIAKRSHRDEGATVALLNLLLGQGALAATNLTESSHHQTAFSTPMVPTLKAQLQAALTALIPEAEFLRSLRQQLASQVQQARDAYRPGLNSWDPVRRGEESLAVVEAVGRSLTALLDSLAQAKSVEDLANLLGLLRQMQGNDKLTEATRARLKELIDGITAASPSEEPRSSGFRARLTGLQTRLFDLRTAWAEAQGHMLGPLADERYIEHELRAIENVLAHGDSPASLAQYRETVAERAPRDEQAGIVIRMLDELLG